MRLTDKQKWSIRSATKRLNIWHGSVRSGKSYAAMLKFIQVMGSISSKKDPGVIDVVCAKTLATLERNVINPIIDLVGKQCAAYARGRQEFKLFDQVLSCFGANDERSGDKLRGTTIRKSFGDELTLWPESFFKMLDTRLSLDDSAFYGTTNPDAPKHYIKEAYIDKHASLDIKTFHFVIKDNPTLTDRYINALANNFTGLYKQRFIHGLWSAPDGLIYDFFTEDENVIVRTPQPIYSALSIDYGTVNPFAAILMGINRFTKPMIWAEDEYVHDSRIAQYQKTDKEYVTDLIAFMESKRGEFWREHLHYTIIDPSAASFKVELEKANFPNITNADNDVDNGIRLVSSMLKARDYAIHERCKYYIGEMGLYRWDNKILTADKPLKLFDHSQDAGRYGVKTLFSGKIVDYDILGANFDVDLSATDYLFDGTNY